MFKPTRLASFFRGYPTSEIDQSSGGSGVGGLINARSASALTRACGQALAMEVITLKL